MRPGALRRGGATLVAGGLLVAAVVVGTASPLVGGALAAAAGLLVAGRRRVPRGARSVAALALCYLAAAWGLAGLGALGLWPLPLLVAVGLYVVAARVPGVELVRDWFARGAGRPAAWGLVAAVVPVSALALLLWHRSLGAGVDAQAPYRELLADRGIGVLLLGGVAFALVNAAAEELVYNGITQRAFRLDLPAAAAVVLTAAVFGASHWYGFPSGWAGVLLAGAYGLLLAAVRHVSGGLVLPWVAHVAADLTIFALLALAWYG